MDYVILCLYIPFGLLWGSGRILRSKIHSGQRVNSALIHQEMLKEMRHLTTLLKILQLRCISVISLQFYCHIFIALIWLQVPTSSKGIWKKKGNCRMGSIQPFVWWVMVRQPWEVFLRGRCLSANLTESLSSHSTLDFRMASL